MKAVVPLSKAGRGGPRRPADAYGGGWGGSRMAKKENWKGGMESQGTAWSNSICLEKRNMFLARVYLRLQGKGPHSTFPPMYSYMKLEKKRLISGMKRGREI